MTYAPAFPKTVNGRTRADERTARHAAEKKAERECYRAVDLRDQGRCRVCGCRVTPGAVDGRQRAEHDVRAWATMVGCSYNLTSRAGWGLPTPSPALTTTPLKEARWLLRL